MNASHKQVVLSVWLMITAAVLAAGCDNRGKAESGSVTAASVGTTIDDGVITAKVKAGLLADPVVKGLDTNVETYKGTVQLSGFVESQVQMDRAVEITRAVVGVKKVDSKMRIKK